MKLLSDDEFLGGSAGGGSTLLNDDQFMGGATAPAKSATKVLSDDEFLNGTPTAEAKPADGASLPTEIGKGVAAGAAGTASSMLKGAAGQNAAMLQSRIDDAKARLRAMDLIDAGKPVPADFGDELLGTQAEVYLNASPEERKGLRESQQRVIDTAPDPFTGKEPPSPGPTGDFKGLVEPGNIDLAKRPKVKMPDGSIATVRSASFNIDGKEVLLPTVSSDGKLLSNQEAIELYRKTGQHLGKFDTPENADVYAEALHQAQDEFYNRPDTSIADTKLYRAGEAVQGWSDEQFKAAKDYEGSWTRAISEGLGSTLPFLLTGPSSGLAAGSFASSGQQIDDAIKHGATKEQILKAVKLGGIPGLTERLPIETLFERIPLPLYGKMANAIGQVLSQAAAEGGQEMLQQAAQNLIAKYVYNPDQDLTEGVLQSGAIGAIVGGGMKSVMPHTYRKDGTPEEPAKGQDIPQGAADADTLFGQESAGGVPPQSADTAAGGPPPPPAATSTEVDRPNSPRLTPEDRASPLPNDLIDDGKKIFEDALNGRKKQPTTAADVPPLDGEIITPAHQRDAARRVADIADEFGPPASQAARPALERTIEGTLAGAEPGSAPVAAPARALSDREFIDGISALDDAAHAAATSPHNALPEPTQAMKEAGNYRKGHTTVGGLDVSIENPQGSTRSGVDPNGKAWSQEMQSHYGYVKGSVGSDGDHVDVFIKPGTPPDITDASPVFVVNQTKGNGTFDETKTMLGFGSQAEADAAYHANYAKGWKGGGDIVPTTLGEFKGWLANGDTTKPFGAPQPAGEIKPINVKQRAAPAPTDIIQFLARSGGIQDFKGELRAIDAHKTFVPGAGKLMREKGMPLDRAREAAAQEGYFDAKYGDRETASEKSTVADLLDLIAETRRGNRQYVAGEQGTAAAPQEVDRHQQEIEALAKEHGLQLTEDLTSEILDRMASGMAPDEAIVDVIERESLAIEHETEDMKGQGEQALDQEIPFDAGPAVATGEKPSDQGGGGQGPVEGSAREAAPQREQSGSAEPDAGRKEAGRGESSLNRTASWVIRNKETGDVVMETFDRAKVDALNTDKYEAVPIGEHLGNLNKKPVAKPEPTAEPGADGKPQTVIPGAERISQGKQAQRGADERMKPKAPQKDAGELFDTQARSEKQDDLPFFKTKPEAVQPTDAFKAQAQAIGTRLRAELDRLGLKDVGLRISENLGLMVDGTMHAADGSYFRKLITVALDAQNPDSVLDHEAIHALHDVGAFSKDEWAILERKSRKEWRDRYEIADAYGSFPDAVQTEEGIAHAYADWRAGRSMDGIIAKAFKKIRGVLQAIGKAFGKDFRTAEDVFAQAASGEVGNRSLTEQASKDETSFKLRNPQTAEDGQKTMQGMIARGQPLDRALRLPFQFFGGVNEKGQWKPGLYLSDKAANIITTAKIDPEGRFGWMAGPVEAARAGLIDRYGLAPEYIERDRQRHMDERAITMRGAEVLKTLAEQNVGANEARVLQAILTGEAVSDKDMQGLAAPIRQAIDELGQEAVSLGLISAESFERNRGSYLHRVYMKHESEQNNLQKLVSQAMGSKRKKILGDTLKGRGLFWEVDAARLNGGSVAKGEKYRVLDKMSADGKVTSRVYLPANQEVPAKYTGAEWRDNGTWEARQIGKGKVTLWRDYSQAERSKMGEILDARYTIGKTYLHMAHDLAVGRFYKDIAENEDWASSSEPATKWVEADQHKRLVNDREVAWVKVPDTTISDTGGKKRWGALSGKWVRSEIWRDLNEIDIMNRPSTWRMLLKQWKQNKTSRNPVTHMNNVMSNLMLMDMQDVRMQDLQAGLRSFISKDKHWQDANEHGVFGADMMTQEIRDNVLKPILEEIEKQGQDGVQNSFLARAGILGKFADRLWSGAKTVDSKMTDLYRAEDDVFRLASYRAGIARGETPEHAAAAAREQFLDYDIHAPWVNAARNSLLPFISYTYRAVPLIARSLATRPWKLAKYAMVAYALNALAYAWDDGDEDKERASLRDEEQGYTWLGTPRMMRMPFRNGDGLPVFLDVRRWIPGGDVFDTNQGSSAVPVPAPLQFGGPLMLAFELALNKSSFTGDPITNDLTDNWFDKSSKVGDYLWKAWMPSAAWVPNSWYWTKIENAIKGATDAKGRPYSLPEAVSSSFGVKLKPQDVETGIFWQYKDMKDVDTALRAEARTLARQRDRGLISQKAFDSGMQSLLDKRDRLVEHVKELQRATRKK